VDYRIWLALWTAVIGRQMRLYLGPLFIVEQKQICADGLVSKLVDQTLESSLNPSINTTFRE
jgi:hypothetical protein